MFGNHGCEAGKSANWENAKTVYYASSLSYVSHCGVEQIL